MATGASDRKTRTAATVVVREGREDDMRLVAEMCMAMVDEVGLPVPPVDDRVTRLLAIAEQAWVMLTTPGSGIYIAELDGDPIGMIAGEYRPGGGFYQPSVAVVWQYVHPEHRGSRASWLLSHCIALKALAAGVPYLTFTVPVGSAQDHGFERRGATKDWETYRWSTKDLEEYLNG